MLIPTDPGAQGGRVKERILKTARSRFEAKGYRRTGIAEVARGAGVAAGTVYRYFTDKEHLFVEVVREMFELWAATTDRVLEEPGTATERLMRLGQASVDFNRENRLFNAILERDENIAFAPLLDEMNEQIMRHNVAKMADVIRDGIAHGEFRADLEPEATAYVLWVGGEALFRQRRRPYDEVLPIYVQIVMHGYAPR